MRTITIKKRTLGIFLLLSIFTISLKSQTIITATNVSGTWNLAGSPYTVQVSTQVLANQALTIDPGVIVKFMPGTKLDITGQLIASGTANQPILFQANDTTSWADSTTLSGGWGGLTFMTYYDPTPDQSVLKYCTITDVKSISPSPTNNAFTCYRKIKAQHCNFTHYLGKGVCIFSSMQTSADTTEFTNCNITNNHFLSFGTFYAAYVMITNNFNGGLIKIKNCDFSNNHKAGVLSGYMGEIVIENNTFHDNDMPHEFSLVDLADNTPIIRANKIYNNHCGERSILRNVNTPAVIENNLICNNDMVWLDPNSGHTVSDGVAIFASGSLCGGDVVPQLIRNNIIANNLVNGEIIYLNNAKATVSNNHIVNNSFNCSYSKFSIFVITYNFFVNLPVATEANIKNNLFFSKSSTNSIDTVDCINIFACSKVLVENNYFPGAFYQNVKVNYIDSLLGDSTSNLIGTIPSMIMPTLNNNYTTNALTANFKLLPNSPCINSGDTVKCMVSTIDYAGSSRITNTIDIGAYEFFELTTGVSATNEKPKDQFTIYPNPATNYINITSEIQISKIEVVNAMGQLMYSENNIETNNKMFDLSTFSSGIYFLQIYSGSGVAIKKVVKQ